MDVHILSLWDALAFEPVKPTYAIRIKSSFSEAGRKLKDSALYKRIVEYTFDDNDHFFQAGPVSITTEIADALLMDFAEHKKGVEALLVHCSRGKNRAPAVAIALNEIFGLGYDQKELKNRFRALNTEVYSTISEAGQRYLIQQKQ
jgi:predicted protein tyrosine phosphatase